MGWVVNATLLPLYPRERPGTHCIGGWVGPRAGLDGCGKSRPPTGIRSSDRQPVASRYTDRAIAAHRHSTVEVQTLFEKTILRTRGENGLSQSQCLYYRAPTSPVPWAHVELLQRSSLILICSPYTYLADPELVRELCKFADSCVFQKPLQCLMLSDTYENITHGCAQIRLFGYIQGVLNCFRHTN